MFNPSQFIANECEKDDVLLFSFLTNTVTMAPPLRLNREELELFLTSLDRALGELDEHRPVLN
jgi:acetylornithine/succinyldiaminopimelate/putrescine aminotransferase